MTVRHHLELVVRMALDQRRIPHISFHNPTISRRNRNEAVTNLPTIDAAVTVMRQITDNVVRELNPEVWHQINPLDTDIPTKFFDEIVSAVVDAADAGGFTDRQFGTWCVNGHPVELRSLQDIRVNAGEVTGVYCTPCNAVVQFTNTPPETEQ